MRKFLIAAAPVVFVTFGLIWYVADLLTACLLIVCIAVLFIILNWWTVWVDNHFDD